MGHRDLLVSHNLPERKQHPSTHHEARASVRRAAASSKSRLHSKCRILAKKKCVCLPRDFTNCIATQAPMQSRKAGMGSFLTIADRVGCEFGHWCCELISSSFRRPH